MCSQQNKWGEVQGEFLYTEKTKIPLSIRFEPSLQRLTIEEPNIFGERAILCLKCADLAEAESFIDKILVFCRG